MIHNLNLGLVSKTARGVLKNKWAIIYILVVCAVLTLSVCWYVGSERTVYYWDTSAYWMRTTGLADWVRTDLWGAIRGVLHTIRHDEYNSLFAAPLSLVGMVFGSSRLTYILSVFFMYYLPATALMAYAITRLLPRPKFVNISNFWYRVIVWSAVVLNPIVILPVLGGYPDVVGLIPVSLATIYYLKIRLKGNIINYLVLAGLLILATFLRRWYVFASAGMMLAIAIDQLLLFWKKREWGWRTTLTNGVKLFALPVAFIGLFVTIAPDYVRELTSTDYVGKYAAYKFHHNYLELGQIIVWHYGAIIFTISLLGIAWAIIRNRYRNRLLIVALMASPVFCFFAVGHVQTFDTHQYYLLTPMFLFGIVASLHFAGTMFFKSQARAFWVACGLLLVAVYLPTAANLYDSNIKITGFTNVKAPPSHRNDIANLQRMYSDVEKMDMFKQDKNATVYVLACSFTLNVDLFRNIPLSLNYDTPHIQNNEYSPSAIFDVAQGFDTHFFNSDIIIDSSPVGYITTNITEQQIISYLHHQIGQGGALATYYSVVRDYQLDNGYRATVYLRNTEVPDKLKDQIVTMIKSFHKDVPIYH